MDKVRVIFMVSVAVVVLLLFGAGIYVAARYTLWVEGAPRPNDMPGIVSYFVLAVNATLAANLGALLGISISVKGWRSSRNALEVLQWVAAGWYVAMLLLAAVFWGLAGFTEDGSKVVSLLPEMTKHAIGILIAVLAAVLGVQTAITRARAIAEQNAGPV
jgi:hypothetical protein